MSTLVFLEHHGSAFQKGPLGVLSKAAELDPDTSAVIIGSGVRDIAAGAGKYGAVRVFVADDPALEAPLPQPRVDVISTLVQDQGFDTVLFAASVLAADVAGGVSARLDAGLNWDLGDLVTRRRRPGGQALGAGRHGPRRRRLEGRAELGLVRAGSFDPAENGGEAAVEDVAVDSRTSRPGRDGRAGPRGAVRSLDRGRRHPGHRRPRPRLPGQFTIARGPGRRAGRRRGLHPRGRGLGWYPYPTQIGQTGKVVSPKLYIGFGVSGAIQHKVGMQTSQVIVSINKDANAPIFEFSDLGVVGDLQEIVPKLTELVKERKAS